MKRNTIFWHLLLFLILINPSVFAQNSINLSFDNEDELQELNWLHTLENWPDMVKEVSIEEGNLIIKPWTSGWYADYMAPFLFTNTTGDFSVEARVRINGIEGGDPKSEWSLGGIMIREETGMTSDTWTPGNQNWLFLTTGVANNINRPVFETKTTIASNSSLRLRPGNREWVTLRIDRNRSVFRLMYRYDHETEYTQLEEFIRPDLPRDLQVGLVAYTDFYSAEQELMDNVRKYNSTVVEYGKPDLTFTISDFEIHQ